MKKRKRTTIFKITSTMPIKRRLGQVDLFAAFGRADVQTYVCAPSQGKSSQGIMTDKISSYFCQAHGCFLISAS